MAGKDKYKGHAQAKSSSKSKRALDEQFADLLVKKLKESGVSYSTANKTVKGGISRYDELIKKFPLRPITSDDMDNHAAEVCNGLLERLNELDQDELDYLDVLSMIVRDYESKWAEEDNLHWTPLELVQDLMESNGLTQKDLIPEFGAASRVSDFLKGKRELSKDQALALSKRFAIRLEAFLRRS